MNNIKEEITVKMLLENCYTERYYSSDSTSTFTSSEEEDAAMKDNERKSRTSIKLFVESTVRSYSNEEFKQHFRICRSTAYKLIGQLKTAHMIPSHVDGREKISAEKAFLLTVWYLSNMETFRQVADRFNVCLSAVHVSIKRVLKYLLSIKIQIIKWPNEHRLEVIRNEFLSKSGINNIIGAIDGSHIEINKPHEDGEVYFNRKGYPSLLIQAIVDHEKKFIDVFCGEPGSLHDARLLRKSSIFAKITSDPDFIGHNFLIGDSAYPNLHWIVTPFKDNGNLTAQQKQFNYRLSSVRVIVEHSFGLLKGRFRRLRKLDNLDLQFCSRLIMGACVLHNICIEDENFMATEDSDFNQPTHERYTNALNICEQANRQVFNELFS